MPEPIAAVLGQNGCQQRIQGETVVKMEKELQQYADIIEQLKSSIGAPEFNQILMQLTQNLPSEKRFLIKMELKRLAKPCVRSIDLRGQVDGECKLFEYRGRKHYLDDVAIDVFNRQVNIFGKPVTRSIRFTCVIPLHLSDFNK